MMLAGEDQALHAGGFDGIHPLIGIEFVRTENAFRFRAVSPLFARICIDGKMDKSIEFHLLELKLAFTWDDLYQSGINFVRCFR